MHLSASFVRSHCPARTNSVHPIQQLMYVNQALKIEKFSIYMIFIYLFNLARLMLNKNRKRISKIAP